MPSQLSSVPPISCRSTTEGPCPASSKRMLMPFASIQRTGYLLARRDRGMDACKIQHEWVRVSRRGELMTSAARRIDVHFHLIPPFYSDAVYAAGRGPAIGKYPDWTPALALDVMDAHGVEVALTSLAQPGVGFGTQENAQLLARRCNEYAAELV